MRFYYQSWIKFCFAGFLGLALLAPLSNAGKRVHQEGSQEVSSKKGRKKQRGAQFAKPTLFGSAEFHVLNSLLNNGSLHQLSFQELLNFAQVNRATRQMVRQVFQQGYEIDLSRKNILVAQARILFGEGGIFEGAKKLNLEGARFTRDVLHVLPESLVELNLSKTSLGNGAFSALGRLTNLRVLKIRKIRNATSEGYANLLKLVNLRYLDMSDNEEGDVVTQIVAQLPQLEYLNLDSSQAGISGISALAAMPHLKELRLVGAEITPEKADALSKSTSLRRIALRSFVVAPEALSILGRMPSLEALELRGLMMGFAEQISQWNHLKELSIYYGTVSPEDMERLTALKQLRSLSIVGCSFEDRSAEYLGRLPLLKKLDLKENNFSDIAAAHLVALANQLEHLDVSDNPVLSGAGLSFLDRAYGNKLFLDEAQKGLLEEEKAVSIIKSMWKE